MDTKSRNIVKWYKSYVSKYDKSYADVICDIPYTVITFNTGIQYANRHSFASYNKLKAIRSWLRANVNGDRYVYCIEATKNKIDTAMYDNGLWEFGKIQAIAFQHDSDAILFKLACNDHITTPHRNS